MVEDYIPQRVWDFGLVYEARILSMIARGPDGIPGLEKITGDTVDITEWLDFTFWDRVWFWDDPNGETGPTLGRWLGVSHRIGSALCYYMIKQNGSIESQTTVQHITTDDMAKPGVKAQVEKFDTTLLDQMFGRHQLSTKSGRRCL